jgi:hypothetical protein
MLFTANTAPAAPTRGDADPLFKELLDEQAYQEGALAFQEEINERLNGAGNRMPLAQGVTVIRADPDGRAPGIGMGIGDMIIKVNDQAVFSKSAFDVMRPSHMPARLAWVKPNGERKEANIPAGLIGVNLKDRYDPIVWYAKSELRKGEWDGDILLAMHLLGNDGAATKPEHLDLAETALARAERVGLPDKMLLFSLGADLMLQRRQFLDAFAFVSVLPDIDMKHRHLLPPERRLRIAMGANQPKYASQLVETYGAIQQGDDPDAIKAWLAVASEYVNAPAPNEVIANAKRIRVNKGLKRDTNQFGGSGEWLANGITKAWRGMRFSLDPGNYRVAAVHHPDGLRDFEIILQLKHTPNTPSHKTYTNMITFGLFTRADFATKRAFNLENQLAGMSLMFEDDRPPSYSLGGYPFSHGASNKDVMLDASSLEKKHFYRILRVGARAQILFGDTVLYDSYIDPNEQDLTLFLHLVGMKVEECGVIVNELVFEDE